ncbi:unnamed protein product [Owenia fusiformis]|uniref:Uncharacterized protein n=1 Tax=Owenia fusiformis TaxID=6347 RepID=A0A8S4Q4Q9_OWEFU|nr:unnamed protein product [Owenia fusiformis]
MKVENVYDLVHHYETSDTPRFKCPYESCEFSRKHSLPEMVINHIILAHIVPQYASAKYRDQWCCRFMDNLRTQPVEHAELYENMNLGSKRFYASQSPIKTCHYSPMGNDLSGTSNSDTSQPGHMSPCESGNNSSWTEQSPGQFNWTPSDIMSQEEAMLWDMRLTASDIKHVVHVPSMYPPMVQPESEEEELSK